MEQMIGILSQGYHLCQNVFWKSCSLCINISGNDHLKLRTPFSQLSISYPERVNSTQNTQHSIKVSHLSIFIMSYLSETRMKQRQLWLKGCTGPTTWLGIIRKFHASTKASSVSHLCKKPWKEHIGSAETMYLTCFMNMHQRQEVSRLV